MREHYLPVDGKEMKRKFSFLSQMKNKFIFNSEKSSFLFFFCENTYRDDEVSLTLSLSLLTNLLYFVCEVNFYVVAA